MASNGLSFSNNSLASNKFNSWLRIMYHYCRILNWKWWHAFRNTIIFSSMGSGFKISHESFSCPTRMVLWGTLHHHQRLRPEHASPMMATTFRTGVRVRLLRNHLSREQFEPATWVGWLDAVTTSDWHWGPRKMDLGPNNKQKNVACRSIIQQRDPIKGQKKYYPLTVLLRIYIKSTLQYKYSTH